MFALIKGYSSMFIGAIVLGVLAYIKYLRSSNEEQQENIIRLKKEIIVRKEVQKDEVKRAIFESKQKSRSIILKDFEISLDEIEAEAKEYEENNPDINLDDFKSIKL